jgi:hypothetical protein
MAPHICAVATLTPGAFIVAGGGEPPARANIVHAPRVQKRVNPLLILIGLQSRLAGKRAEA